jgi:hypothetical protein
MMRALPLLLVLTLLAWPTAGHAAPRATADVQLTLGATGPLSGGEWVLRPRWTNLGPDAAGSSALQLDVPVGFDLTGILELNTLCSVQTRRVICSTLQLQPGNGAGADMFMRPALSTTSVIATATVSAAATDPVPANNSARVRLGPAPKPRAYLASLYAADCSASGDPDLAVSGITTQPGNIVISIANIGRCDAVGTFWVDLSIGRAMQRVNDTWNTVPSGQGAAWTVDGLRAGATLTLTVGGPGYQPAASNLPDRVSRGTLLSVQVDSANTQSGGQFGAIRETHERLSGPYDTSIAPVNNILNKTTENDVDFP